VVQDTQRNPIACETPKSPPGDYNWISTPVLRARHHDVCETPKSPPGDYNLAAQYELGKPRAECETPKSPPGDYNQDVLFSGTSSVDTRLCETPKSPPGDYNLVPHRPIRRRRGWRCETPKSPPGDYNQIVFPSSVKTSSPDSV